MPAGRFLLPQAEPPMLKLKLPYPPSINHYWRHVGPRVLISRQGRKYRTQVMDLCRRKNITTIRGPLSVEIELHMPDRRRRDIDNVLKAMLDALQWGGVYEDDNQVMRLAIEKVFPEDKPKPKRRTKKEIEEGKDCPKPFAGEAIVRITEVETEPKTQANRICLRCDQPFDSTGLGNRICGDCDLSQRCMSPNAEPTWAGKRRNGKAL